MRQYVDGRSERRRLPQMQEDFAHRVEARGKADGELSFSEFMERRWHVLLQLAVLLHGGDEQAAQASLRKAMPKSRSQWHRIQNPEAYVRQRLYRSQFTFRWKPRLRWVRVSGCASDQRPVKTELQHALSQLTPRQRTVLLMRYYEDLPLADVARLLGCSAQTVHVTMHHALARLRQCSPKLFCS